MPRPPNPGIVEPAPTHEVGPDIMIANSVQLCLVKARLDADLEDHWELDVGHVPPGRGDDSLGGRDAVLDEDPHLDSQSGQATQ